MRFGGAAAGLGVMCALRAEPKEGTVFQNWGLLLFGISLDSVLNIGILSSRN
jgi:hypothetical protein